jgi:hypothetical protein
VQNPFLLLILQLKPAAEIREMAKWLFSSETTTTSKIPAKKNLLQVK